MKAKTKPTPRARRMWANYYPENPARPVIHESRKSAKHCVAPGATHAAIPVAVIPLHDPEALISRASYVVDNMISTATIGDIVRAVLVSSGVLPKSKGGAK